MTPDRTRSRAAERLEYLDGLRGWMALVVVLTHLFGTYLIEAKQLDAHGAGWLNFLFDWTPLGALGNGKQAVYVFFAISGVALSYPVLRSAKPAATLAAMAAYRYPRLMIPVLVSCVLAWLLLASGLFFNARAAQYLADGKWWAELYNFPPDFADMLTYALWRAFGYEPRSWNTVLWTMKAELNGSFLLFALLALAQWRRLRLLVALGLVVWCANTASDGAYLVGFIVGYGLAELLIEIERSPALRLRVDRAAWLGWIFLALALAGATFKGSHWLGADGSDFRLQYNATAALAVCGVILARPMQVLLSNRLSRFLGRISFGLYLTHLLVICSFGSALFLATMNVMPYWAVVMVTGLPTFGVAVVVGFAFTRIVEEGLMPVVKTAIQSRIVAPCLRLVGGWLPAAVR
jgi:peptidoglycan/LPS O-acetylase OafA/YrhL